VNSRYLEDDDLDAPRDREISLGATTLLGIFLLLALVCAVFFGFGYSMGRRSAVATAPAADPEETSTLKTTGGAKPAPGLTPAGKPSAEATATSDDSDSAAPQLPQPTQAATAQPAQQKPQPAAAASAKPAAYSPAPQFTPPAVVSKAAPPPAAPHSAATAAPAGPPALVQVAAVSHQEDADILVNSLKRRGYDVTVRHEPQDKLFHIQIGPYPIHKDADAMRQRLLADGYNAIVK
jgi:cell division septation protein DedD